MQDIVAFLALPFAASVAFVGIHAYLGLHVLRRGIVFADLALAQLSALGATVAFAAGHAPTSIEGFGYTLLFTGLGAVLLTLSRSFARAMSQEAFIGILYVVATAATIVIVDRSPQGAEHVKKILIGSILTVSASDLLKFALVYGAIGIVHAFIRRPLLALSEEGGAAGRPAWQVAAWDLVFYLSFGVVVTSSVAAAGVLLVFCFLIIPAVVGMLFTRRIGPALLIGWGAGIAASAAGLLGSFLLDLPTGAAMVLTFALALAMAGAVRLFVFAPGRELRRRLGAALRIVAGICCAALLLGGLWLVAEPHEDQPVAAALEWLAGTGFRPFLHEDERAIYDDAREEADRLAAELDALNARERDARWRGRELSDDEVRRVGSYQQTFNEMARGELFVMETLRGKARERERWIAGLPALGLAAAGLFLLLRRRRAARAERGAGANSVAL
ncbi:MAG TPA: metal ABC transporter permease [Stellaceae bacterium]|nr:metal ABC transporter permease [Stellaceae bacterium]